MPGCRAVAGNKGLGSGCVRQGLHDCSGVVRPWAVLGYRVDVLTDNNDAYLLSKRTYRRQTLTVGLGLDGFSNSISISVPFLACHHLYVPAFRMYCIITLRTLEYIQISWVQNLNVERLVTTLPIVNMRSPRPSILLPAVLYATQLSRALHIELLRRS